MFVRFVDVKPPVEDLELWEPTEIILEMSIPEADEFMKTHFLDHTYQEEYKSLRMSAETYVNALETSEVTAAIDPRGRIGFLFSETGSGLGLIDLFDVLSGKDNVRWRQVPPVHFDSISDISNYMSIWQDMAHDYDVAPWTYIWHEFPIPALDMSPFFSTYDVFKAAGLEGLHREETALELSKVDDLELYARTLLSFLPDPALELVSEHHRHFIWPRKECLAEWNRRVAMSTEGQLRQTIQSFHYRACRLVSNMQGIEFILSDRDFEWQKAFASLDLDQMVDVAIFGHLIEWRHFYPAAFALTERFDSYNEMGRDLTLREQNLARHVAGLASSIRNQRDLGSQRSEDESYTLQISQRIGSDSNLTEDILRIVTAEPITEDDTDI